MGTTRREPCTIVRILRANERALWVLYTAFIVYGGTIPFHFAGDLTAVAERLRELPLNPFVSPDTGRRLSIPDVVQNLLLFVPFGALGVAAAGPRRDWTWRRILLVTGLGAALSLVVESLQLATRDRVASLGDVMTNTTGALAGGIAARAFGGWYRAILWRLRSEGLAEVPELRIAAIAALIVAICFLQPFDVTLEVGTVGSKVRALERDLWQMTAWRDEGLVLIVTALFAMALSSYLWALGERGPARKAAVLGAGAVCALEAVQILIRSRMPGLWDATVGVTGIVIGTAIWALSSRIQWPALWQGVLVAMSALAAAMQLLSPFDWAPEYRGFTWFPLQLYYERTTFDTLSHVIELSLSWFPLGFCLGLALPDRRRALFTALAITLAIAAPLEAAQGWVAGRYADVSGILLSLAGAWAGVMAARTKP